MSVSRRPLARLLLGPMLALWLALWLSIVHAGSIEPVRASLLPTDDGYALSAEFTVDLGHRVEEAVARGIPLYFILEFELTRARWYWTSEKVAERVINYRLSYHPLTRQYRLATGSLYRSFDTLDDALYAMRRVAALPVAERGALKAGESYQAAVRLSLDRGQLPKPFQLDAIGNRDWDITSHVFRWQIPAGEAK